MKGYARFALVAAVLVGLGGIVAPVASAPAAQAALFPAGCVSNGVSYGYGFPWYYHCWDGQNPNSYNTGEWYVGANQTVMQRYATPRLFVAVDCIFGPQTQAATLQYQANVGADPTDPPGVFNSWLWSRSNADVPFQNKNQTSYGWDYYYGASWDNVLRFWDQQVTSNQSDTWHEYGSWYQQTSYAQLTTGSAFSCSI